MLVCSFCEKDSLLNSCVCGKVSYCGLECQKRDWMTHKPNCPPFKIINIPGKGRGIVATRKINVGDIILEEMPLMVIDSANSEISASGFQKKYETLDNTTKEKILSLFDPLCDEIKLDMKTSISKIEASLGINSNQSNAEQVKDLSEQLSSLNTDLEDLDSTDNEMEKALRIFAGNSIQV